MPHDHTGRHSGIGGHRLVSRVAGDDAWMRPADNAAQYQDGGRVAVVARELLQTGGITIHNRSRRDAMDESCAPKALVRE